KVEGNHFKLVDKTRILEKMFDRRYSVNELVKTADGEKITEFISNLMIKNKKLETRLWAKNSDTRIV
ncbi:TPA: hypothetical protein ACL61Z_002155, partial [Streptococcus pneumoniae]